MIVIDGIELLVGSVFEHDTLEDIVKSMVLSESPSLDTPMTIIRQLSFHSVLLPSFFLFS